MTMTKSPIWLRVRTSKARLNDWVKVLEGVRITVHAIRGKSTSIIYGGLLIHRKTNSMVMHLRDMILSLQH
jgi:hypothetical protein